MCSLKDHSICEVIDYKTITVIDFNVSLKYQNSFRNHKLTKLYDVEKNIVCKLPANYLALPLGDSDDVSRSFASYNSAFSLTSPQ